VADDLAQHVGGDRGHPRPHRLVGLGQGLEQDPPVGGGDPAHPERDRPPPPAARVAYAEAISSGVTSPVPSTALGTARSRLATPIRAAASTTARAPRSASPPPRRSSSPA
jgi:hypothetical protein